MEQFARALGKVEQATVNLNENITGLRKEIKSLTDVMMVHHDRLKDGDHKFDAQERKFKVIEVWLAIITLLEIPSLLPQAKIWFGKIF
jgi:hypothetical protein